MITYFIYLKTNYRYDHLFAHRTSLHNLTLIHCCLNMCRRQEKVIFFLPRIKKSTKTTQIKICNKFLMHFFPSDRKVTNHILVWKNMKNPSTALRFFTPKKLKYAILVKEDRKVTEVFIFGRMGCYCRFIKMILKLLKYCQNDIKMVSNA